MCKEAVNAAAEKAAAVFKECLQCGGDPEKMKFKNAAECVLWRNVLTAGVTAGLDYAVAVEQADMSVIDYRHRAVGAKDGWTYEKPKGKQPEWTGKSNWYQ